MNPFEIRGVCELILWHMPDAATYYQSCLVCFAWNKELNKILPQIINRFTTTVGNTDGTHKYTCSILPNGKKHGIEWLSILKNNHIMEIIRNWYKGKQHGLCVEFETKSLGNILYVSQITHYVDGTRTMTGAVERNGRITSIEFYYAYSQRELFIMTDVHDLSTNTMNFNYYVFRNTKAGTGRMSITSHEWHAAASQLDITTYRSYTLTLPMSPIVLSI